MNEKTKRLTQLQRKLAAIESTDADQLERALKILSREISCDVVLEAMERFCLNDLYRIRNRLDKLTSSVVFGRHQPSEQ